MQQEDRQLAATCQQLQESTKQALEWLSHNKDKIGTEFESINTDLRRAGRIYKKCEIAAMRKMCVGVFGPSQSGKSYLISALAKDAQGTLIANFNGISHDFITEINPAGGKESTGLVTRFTTTALSNLPDGYPIRLRLLSECDVVRVIANTFYADCEHKETPNQESILAELSQLDTQTTTSNQNINSDDIEDLREYLYNNFASRPRVQLLQRTFWHKAMELAPKLDLQGRAKLFAIIWDGLEEFTNLYLTLCKALESLEFTAEAHCSLEALIPRELSIIDVALLKNLSDASTNKDLLNVMGPNKIIQLPRCIVTALTAEITIYMSEKPDDFFDHTDLLDFPGYRSRLKLEDVRKELSRDGMLENLFLRGKVAYLFERYCAEKELTSMLLCIGPGNQEVQDLPRAVQQWIASTHGESPARRAKANNETGPSLFFILTKMDMEFEKKKGTPSVESRWCTRLQSSLIDFFGKNDDWPTNWDGKNPFNNLFLLRNPNFRCEAIFNFEHDKEVSIRQEQHNYVAEVKNAFLNSPLVKAHVKNPQNVWDAAMALNDGGVELLRKELRPLCNPALKRRQIIITLAQSLERINTALSAHWKSDNKEEERARKDILARNLIAIISKIAETQRFGEFLRSLQVNDHDLYDIYFSAEQQRLQEDEQNNAIVGTRFQAEELFQNIFGDAPPTNENIAANTSHKDEAERFTNLVIEYWIEQMHSIAASHNAQQYFNFPERELGFLVHELALSVQRLAIAPKMAQDQRKASSYGNLTKERLIWKQVSIAANAINAFVNWLGFDPRYNDNTQRTVIMQEKPFVIFNPPSVVQEPPSIGENEHNYDKVWFIDWSRALVHNLYANVDFDGDATFNFEQNAKLTKILEQFNINKLNEIRDLNNLSSEK